MPDIKITLGQNMKNTASLSAGTLLLGTVLFLGGCATGQPVMGPAIPDQKTGTEPYNALTISDIPIPAGAKMDTESSLIMGTQDRWLGRIVIKTDNSPTHSYNHFYNGMAAFGWGSVTAVQARISSLTYLRGERVASIQIEPTTLGGSSISITVSPRQTASQKQP